MANLAVAGEPRLFGAPLRGARPLAAIAAAFAAESDRRILWLPVFFATGILTRDNQTCLYCGVAIQHGDDLVWLDPVSENLYLIIDPPKISNFAALQIASEVSSFVKACCLVITDGAERIMNEPFGR